MTQKKTCETFRSIPELCRAKQREGEIVHGKHILTPSSPYRRTQRNSRKTKHEAEPTPSSSRERRAHCCLSKNNEKNRNPTTPVPSRPSNFAKTGKKDNTTENDGTHSYSKQYRTRINTAPGLLQIKSAIINRALGIDKQIC